MEEQSVPRKYESVSKEDPIRVLMNSNSFRAVRFVAVTLATSSQPVPARCSYQPAATNRHLS